MPCSIFAYQEDGDLKLVESSATSKSRVSSFAQSSFSFGGDVSHQGFISILWRSRNGRWHSLLCNGVNGEDASLMQKQACMLLSMDETQPSFIL